MNLIRGAIAGIVTMFLVTAFSHSSSAEQVINIEVNGQTHHMDPSPILENGNVFIPLRTVSDVLGYKVDWSQVQKTAILTGIDSRITLNITNNKAFKNETPLKMKLPIKLVKNSIFVPLRFISEAMGDEVQWKKESKTVSIQGKYILTKAKHGDSEYWINKMNGDLYVVKENTPPKKLGTTGLSVPVKYQQDFSVSVNAFQTPKGNILLSIHNNYGEPHLNNEVFSVYIKDNKIIDRTKAYYYNRWYENVRFYNDLVILTDGKKAYVYDDRTATLSKKHDLVLLGAEDENYFIEGIGNNYILIRPNQKGHLLLYNFITNQKITLYKELFKNEPTELEYAEMNDVPYFGDVLQFIEEKKGVLYFNNNSPFNKEKKIYKYSIN